MRRLVVLGGGFAGVETIRCLDKRGRGRLQVTRDLRPPTRCPICAQQAARMPEAA